MSSNSATNELSSSYSARQMTYLRTTMLYPSHLLIVTRAKKTDFISHLSHEISKFIIGFWYYVCKMFLSFNKGIILLLYLIFTASLYITGCICITQIDG